jgi:hypothetical protein
MQTCFAFFSASATSAQTPVSLNCTCFHQLFLYESGLKWEEELVLQKESRLLFSPPDAQAGSGDLDLTSGKRSWLSFDPYSFDHRSPPIIDENLGSTAFFRPLSPGTCSPSLCLTVRSSPLTECIVSSHASSPDHPFIFPQYNKRLSPTKSPFPRAGWIQADPVCCMQRLYASRVRPPRMLYAEKLEMGLCSAKTASEVHWLQK